MTKKIFEKERRLAVRLEEEQHRKAHEKAANQGMTLSDVIRRLINKWLKGEIDVNG